MAIGKIMLFAALACMLSCAAVAQAPQASLLDEYHLDHVDRTITLPTVVKGTVLELDDTAVDINLGISVQGWPSVDGVPCKPTDLPSLVKRRAQGTKKIRLLVWQDYRCPPEVVAKILALAASKQTKSSWRIGWSKQGALVGIPIQKKTDTSSPSATQER